MFKTRRQDKAICALMNTRADRVTTLLDSGLTLKEIAAELSLSEKTITRVMTTDQKAQANHNREAKDQYSTNSKIYDMLSRNPEATSVEVASELGVGMSRAQEAFSRFVLAHPERWMRKCDQCAKRMIEVYGVGRFCSAACARGFASSKVSADGRKRQREALSAPATRAAIAESQRANPRRWSDEGRALLSERLKAYHADPANKPKTLKAARNRRKVEWTPAMRAEASRKGKETAQRAMANGTHKPWQTRDVTSYPERFWKRLLDEAGVDYLMNHPVRNEKPSGYYFLDFYIVNERGEGLDLEIDGKQHQRPAERRHDAMRTEHLSSKGLTVLRSPWCSGEKLHEEIKRVQLLLSDFLGKEIVLTVDSH